jgi:hypothetical protein
MSRLPLALATALTRARLLAGLAGLACLLGVTAPATASRQAGPQRAPHRLEVRGLADWDRLKMRLAPGPSSPAVGEIPPRASGVVGTGRQRHVGRAVWHQVEYQGVRGWVHGRYVRREAGSVPDGHRREPAARVFPEDLVCVGSGPPWKLVVDRDGSTAASASFGRTLADVHALPAEPQKPAAQKSGARAWGRTWSMTLEDAQGVGVATLILREARCSAGNVREVYGYEVTTHLPNGSVLSGCCNRRPRGTVVQASTP